MPMNEKREGSAVVCSMLPRFRMPSHQSNLEPQIGK